MSFNTDRRVYEKEYRSWEIDFTSFQPLHSGVLLERVETPSESPIIIPDTAKIPTHLGKVLRVGPGKRRPDGSRIVMHVQPGQIVRYQSADMDNGTHVLIEEADILGVEN